jgi:hypothetical protein
MNPQSFANLLSIVLAFVASLFFCLGSAEMKPKDIGTLAGTYWDSNPHLKAFLISLKADYLCGAFALCLAFFLQFIANIPGTIPTEPIFISVPFGAVLAVFVGAVFGCLLYLYRKWVVSTLNKQFTSEYSE